MYLLMKIIFFFLTITCAEAKISSAVISPASNSLNFYQILENILNQCFRNNLNPLIVSKEISQQFQYLHNQNHLKPMIIVDDDFQAVKTYHHYPTISTLVLVVDSIHQFDLTLKHLNSSVWWTGSLKCILIRSDQSCSNVSEIFHVIWRSRLLSVIFLCYVSDDGVMIYTYNPFSSQAPDPWIEVERSNTSSGMLTLLKRRHQADQDNCFNLLFDQLKFMNGFRLNCISIPKPGTVWDPNINYDQATLPITAPTKDANFILTVFEVWNVTGNIHYNSTLYYMKRNYFQLILAPLYMITWDRDLVVPAYPLQSLSLVILTQKRPFLNPEDIIMSFYSPGVFMMSTLSFGAAIIALMLNKKQRLSTAALEIERLLISCGVEQPLTNAPIRIFFSGILWLALIINSTFQGNLATFLTKPARISINTLDDLKEYKFDIHTYKQYNNNFVDSFLPVKKLLIFHNSSDAYKHVLNNSRAAYITSLSRAYGPAYRHQLHVSPPFLPDYISMAVPKSFPFTQQIDEIAFKCFESGLLSLWDAQDVYKFKNNLTITEALETEPRFRIISIRNLAFAFKILAIGLGCSLVVFEGEIASNLHRKKKKKKVDLGTF